MIIDAKGKLFGKVNVIDLVVVIAVILCVAGVFLRFRGQAGKTIVKPDEFYYEVELKKVRKMTVDMLDKAKGTSFTLADKGRSDDMGVLMDYVVTPAVESIEMQDGTMIERVIPRRWDVRLTLKLNGKMNAGGYMTPQLMNIGAGKQFLLKSKWVSSSGRIVKVWQQ